MKNEIDLDEIVAEAKARTVVLPEPKRRRYIRKRSRLKQSEIAVVLGVDPASISYYEAGKREPRGEVRRAYGRLLERLAKEVLG